MNKRKNNILTNISRKMLKSKKTIIMIIMVVIFLIYCIVLLFRLLINPTKTFIVEQGKIYNEENLSGYIIRDESVIEEEISKDKMVQLKSEGCKVAKGEALYRYSLENEQQINQEIQKLDGEIQNALKAEKTIFSTDIKLLESNVEQRLENVYEITDIQKIENYKKEIKSSINKKSKIAGDLTASSSYLKELISKRSEYENQLNNGTSYVYANKSGVLSYKIDGLENVLTVGDFSYLNQDFLKSLNIKTSQIVASSNNSVKIIDNYKCYIVCVTKSNEAIQSNEGDNLNIRLPDSTEVPAKITYKQVQGNGEVLLVFEIDQCVENLISHRKISFDIIWWSNFGLKIPNEAIQYENDLAYVIRNRAGYEEKIWIKIKRKNDIYAIVSNYSTAELEELGFDLNDANIRKSISIYDEVVIKQ